MQSRSGYKRILFFVVLLICNSEAHSQVIIALVFGDKLNSDKLEFGLTGGLSISDISNFQNTQTKTGFNLGLYLTTKLNDRWYMQLEAVPKYPTGISNLEPYTLHDANLDSLLKSANVTRQIKNIVLPLLMRYRIKGQLFANAGPQIGLRTKAKDVFKQGSLTYENTIEDQLTRFDFGFAWGLTQKLGRHPSSISLNIRNYFGLIDIDKRSTGAQTNNVWQMNASIAVGAKKKNQQQK